MLRWAQVPEAPTFERAPLLAAVAPAALPLAIHLRDLHHDAGWLLGWVVPLLVAQLLVAALGRRGLTTLLGAAVASVPVLSLWWGPPAGWRVALVAAASIVVWTAIAGVAPAARATLVARRLSLLAAVPAVLLLLLAPGLLPAAVLLALAVLVVLVAELPEGGPLASLASGLERRAGPATSRVGGAVRGVARAARRVVEVVLMAPVAAFVLVLWSVHRVVGHDPLRGPAAHPGTWVRRAGTDPHPERAYSATSIVDERPLRARVSSRLPAALALLAVAALVVRAAPWEDDERGSTPPTAEQATSDERGTEDPDPAEPAPPSAAECGPAPDDPVRADQPQLALLECERAAAYAQGDYQHPGGFQLQDYAGETIQIEDGVRRTWRPPACECRRLRVWWLGGSQAWGEGARDLHTLPSALARAAWDAGYALDIENRAMPTWTLNQSAHTLASLLVSAEPPDLVISLDGGNDLVFQALRAGRGQGDDDRDITLLDQTFDDVLRNGIPVDPDRIEWTPIPDALAVALEPEVATELATTAMRRYERNAELVDLLAEATGVTAVLAWQPLLAGSPRPPGQPEVVPDDLLAFFDQMVATARDLLPSDVIDLGGAFDDTTEPVFYDLFHTSERGAAVLADALLAELAPTLDEVLQGPGG